MSSPLHVALVGATGNLSPAILTQLLAAGSGFKVTILARVGSGSKVKAVLPTTSATSTSTASANTVSKTTGTASDSVTIKEVDYASHSSLVQALSSPPVDVVVCTLGWFPGFFETQKALIDASIEAGCVKRFLPSEFGNGANANVRKLPLLFNDKSRTQEYLVETVEKAAATVQKNNNKTDPGSEVLVPFSYTIINTGSFLDWQLELGFMVNLKDHTATLYDGGDVRCSATRMVTIGEAVVRVLHNLDATKDRHVFVHDAAITQNQLIGMAKKIDGNDKEWTTTSMSTADVERNAYKALEEGDFMSATLGFISRACWGQGFGQDFSDKLDNDLLGIPVTSEEEIESMMRDIMAKLL